MRIQHNIMAMNSYRNYGANTNALGKNLEKLSSGYKINRAGDDAAGLAISEKMRAQISGLKQAQSNVKDGISLVKTAEGALQEVQDMMNRMVTLATQSANGTYDDDVDRANLQKEVEALSTEIDRIADSSNFNGTKLLDGSMGPISQIGTMTAGTGTTGTGSAATIKVDFTGKTGKDVIGGSLVVDGKSYHFVKADATNTDDANTNNYYIKVAETADADAIAAALNTKNGTTFGDANTSDGAVIVTAATKGSASKVEVSQLGSGLQLQIGDTADSYNQIKVKVGDMHTKALGIDTASINVEDQKSAAEAIKKIKDAINTVSGTRGDLGAIQNRLEHTTNNLAIMTENIQDAESTIRDVDIADEMTAYTKNNILLQSAQAMLAQANQMPQGVLQLLQ